MTPRIIGTSLVPDEPDQIQAAVLSWTDKAVPHAHLVVTLGGTGFSVRLFRLLSRLIHGANCSRVM